MKTAVIYATKTGHSKKLAQAIAKELKVTEQNIRKNPKLEHIDLLVIVGGIYGNQSLPELTGYLKDLDNNMVKKVALVTSCATKKAKQEDVRKILNEKSIDVVNDEFICQGNFLFMGLMHPNKSDLDSAISYVKRIASASK